MVNKAVQHINQRTDTAASEIYIPVQCEDVSQNDNGTHQLARGTHRKNEKHSCQKTNGRRQNVPDIRETVQELVRKMQTTLSVRDIINSVLLGIRGKYINQTLQKSMRS